MSTEGADALRGALNVPGTFARGVADLKVCAS
jgi:hypothetical protein